MSKNKKKKGGTIGYTRSLNLKFIRRFESDIKGSKVKIITLIEAFFQMGSRGLYKWVA